MSRMFLITVVMASSLSSASAQIKEEKAAPAGTVRVAVLNIAVVFTKYERAHFFKKELDELMAAFKVKDKALKEQLEARQKKLLVLGLDGAAKAKLEADIRNDKAQLEELQRGITQVVAKKHEDNLVELWKEVQDAIKSYAIQHGIQLVLGYGDPMGKELLDQFPNINRKMQAMDLGGTVPLYAAPGLDIADGVVALLNSRYRAMNKANALKRFVD